MWGSWGLRLSSGSSGRISGGFLRGYWLRDTLWLWWELVTSHVVVNLNLVMVSSGCKLGSLLVGRAWFSSIGVGSNCIGGGPIESSVGGIPVQAVNRTVQPSKWYLGRWVLLGVGVSLGDGFSSAGVEALVGVRHSGGFSIAWALSVSIAWALSVSTAVSSVYRRSWCCSGLSILPCALLFFVFRSAVCGLRSMACALLRSTACGLQSMACALLRSTACALLFRWFAGVADRLSIQAGVSVVEAVGSFPHLFLQLTFIDGLSSLSMACPLAGRLLSIACALIDRLCIRSACALCSIDGLRLCFIDRLVFVLVLYRSACAFAFALYRLACALSIWLVLVKRRSVSDGLLWLVVL